MDATSTGGQGRFLMRLNEVFAEEANARRKLLVQDVHAISARIGLDHWFDWDRFFAYKVLLRPEANFALARSLTSLVRAIYGKSRKVLVLDLDNTLWGGVIGDDGVDRIQIGRENPTRRSLYGVSGVLPRHAEPRHPAGSLLQEHRRDRPHRP